jgi:predicted RNase H-like HicB family nuclease
MKLPVILERDETGMIIAECPAIPGCVSQGRTEDEAIANIREAIVGCLEVRAEEGMPLTVRTVVVDVAVACAAGRFGLEGAPRLRAPLARGLATGW